MVYPQAPWTLKGYSVQMAQLLAIDRIQAVIPAVFTPVAILPGKTLGGIYLASYGAGSTLEYNELIVVSAIVRQGYRLGAWISHIYVDHPDSVAGGREIWGLPKELAQFHWHSGSHPQVQVVQGDQLLCDFQCHWLFPGWRQSLTVPVFSLHQFQPLQFQGQASVQFSWANATLNVPATSPFAALGWGRSGLSFYSSDLCLKAGVPTPLE